MGTRAAGGGAQLSTSAERQRGDRLARRARIRTDPALWTMGVLGAAWLAGFAALIRFTGDSVTAARFVSEGVYLVPIVLAAGLSARAARRSQGPARSMWRLLAVSNAAWLCGELIWSGYAFLGADHEPPFPSAADVLYLLAYVLAIPAILKGFSHAGYLRQLRGWLDAVLVIASLGATGWRLLISPQLTGEIGLDVVVSAAYPMLDLVVLGCLISVGVAGHRFVPYSALLVGLAYCFASISDATLNYLVAGGQAVTGGWINLGWQAQAVLMCLAALVAIRHREDPATAEALDRDLTLIPVLLAAVTSFGMVMADQVTTGAVARPTMVVAGLMLAGLMLRQFLFTKDRSRLTRRLQQALREQERVAVTDGLTRLYNRRFLLEMLKLEADRSGRAQRPLSLAVIDLDHFKRVNDTHGHPVGDLVLVQAADRIRLVSRSTDIVARYGGEEFVILLPDTDEGAALELGERVRRELHRSPVRSPRGDDIVMTGSVGVATARVDQVTGVVNTERLVADADRALYQAKAQGRNRTVVAGRNTVEPVAAIVALPFALTWIADRIDACLGTHEHSTAVERWTRLVGRRLGLDGAALGRLAAAARLHDVGKAAVDEAILRKPGKLDPHEWDQLRTHCEEGGRLLRDLGHSDLAPLVEAHHERFDGTGYPRGLAGRKIPIEARIIAVCDSWAAMRVDRAYARAKTINEAWQEVLDGRGGQFDPEVADAFLALVSAGLIDEPRPLTAGHAPTTHPDPVAVPAPVG